MTEKTSIDFKATKWAITKAGYIYSGFAVANGIKPNTLMRVLSGKYPCPTAPRHVEIVEVLRSKGLLVEKPIECDECGGEQ